MTVDSLIPLGHLIALNCTLMTRGIAFFILLLPSYETPNVSVISHLE